jgi:hypothetical protein
MATRLHESEQIRKRGILIRKLLIQVGILWVGARAAVGCSCGGALGLCDKYELSPVVAVVLVTAESLASNPAFSIADAVVEAAWKGIEKESMSVQLLSFTQAGKGTFVPGTRYVVFGSWKQMDGKNMIFFSCCSGNLELPKDQRKHELLRRTITGNRTAVFGQALDGDYGARGLEGVVISARKGAQLYEALSDQDGMFQLLDLEPGRYEIQMSKPGYSTKDRWGKRVGKFRVAGAKSEPLTEDTVFLSNGRCEDYPFHFHPNH